MRRRTFLQALALLPTSGYTNAGIADRALSFRSDWMAADLPGAVATCVGSLCERWDFRNFLSHSGVAHARSVAWHFSVQQRHVRPLIIIGTAGNGKSHLAHAIAQRLRATTTDDEYPGVAYVDGERLLAAKGKPFSTLIEPWRAEGGAIIDDAQYLMSDSETSGALAETIAVLRDARRPVVLTMNIGCHEFAQLTGKRAFEALLVDAEIVVVSNPDPQEGARIIRCIAQSADVGLPRAVSEMLAAEIGEASVQSYIDAVRWLQGWSMFHGVAIDRDAFAAYTAYHSLAMEMVKDSSG